MFWLKVRNDNRWRVMKVWLSYGDYKRQHMVIVLRFDTELNLLSPVKEVNLDFVSLHYVIGNLTESISVNISFLNFMTLTEGRSQLVFIIFSKISYVNILYLNLSNILQINCFAMQKLKKSSSMIMYTCIFA